METREPQVGEVWENIEEKREGKVTVSSPGKHVWVEFLDKGEDWARCTQWEWFKNHWKFKA